MLNVMPVRALQNNGDEMKPGALKGAVGVHLIFLMLRRLLLSLSRKKFGLTVKLMHQKYVWWELKASL